MKKIFIIFLNALIFSFLKGQNNSLVPCQNKNLWGLCSIDHKLKVNYQYDKIIPCSKGFIVQNNDKFGWLNSNGIEKVKCNYINNLDYIESLDIIETWEDGAYHYLDTNGNKLNLNYDDITSTNKKGYAIIKKNNLKGVLNNKFIEIIPCLYEDLYFDNSNKMFRVSYEGYVGLIDTNGKNIRQIKYKNIYSSNFATLLEKENGYLELMSNTDYSFKNLNCKLIKYFDENHNIYIVQENDTTKKFLLINSNQKVQFSKEYDNFELINHIKESEENLNLNEDKILFKVMKNQKWGIIDAQLKEIVPLKFDEINDLFIINTSNKKIVVAKTIINNKYGFINVLDGEEILPCIYDEIEFDSFNSNVVKIRINDKVGFINVSDKINTVPCIYDNINFFKSNYFSYLNYYNPNYIQVSVSDKFGIINLQGKEIIPLKYNRIEFSTNGCFFYVLKDSLWGIIDTTGKEVVPCNYQEIGVFTGKYLKVKKNGSYGFYKPYSREIVPCIFSESSDYFNLAIVKKNDSIYVIKIKKSGKIKYKLIKNRSYDNYFVFKSNHSYLAVNKNGKWGLVDEKFNEIIPCSLNLMFVEDPKKFPSFKYLLKSSKSNIDQTNTNFVLSDYISYDTNDDLTKGTLLYDFFSLKKVENYFDIYNIKGDLIIKDINYSKRINNLLIFYRKNKFGLLRLNDAKIIANNLLHIKEINFEEANEINKLNTKIFFIMDENYQYKLLFVNGNLMNIFTFYSDFKPKVDENNNPEYFHLEKYIDNIFILELKLNKSLDNEISDYEDDKLYIYFNDLNGKIYYSE